MKRIRVICFAFAFAVFCAGGAVRAEDSAPAAAVAQDSVRTAGSDSDPATKGDIRNLREEIHGLDKQMVRLEERMNGLERRMDGLEKRMDRQEQELREMREELRQIRDTMQTNFRWLMAIIVLLGLPNFFRLDVPHARSRNRMVAP